MTGPRYTSVMTSDPGTNPTKEDSMRMLLPRGRHVLLASAAVVALAAAGIAIAGLGAPAGTSLVSATFFANTLVRSHSDACTPAAPADAFTSTDAVFTGTASSSDPRLAGPITIHVKSVYDSTKNVGSLKGDVDIQTSTTPPGRFDARLTAVNVNGAVQGWLDGNLGDGSRFAGSFSAAFSPTGGFSSSGTPGTIGSGTGTNTAIVWNGNCSRPKPAPPSPPHNGPRRPGHGDDNDQGNQHGDHGHHGHHDH
jgi:hypothetical protein